MIIIFMSKRKKGIKEGIIRKYDYVYLLFLLNSNKNSTRKTKQNNFTTKPA